MIDQHFTYVAFGLSAIIAFLLTLNPDTPIVVLAGDAQLLMTMLTSCAAAIGLLLAIRARRSASALVSETSSQGCDVYGCDAWKSGMILLCLAFASTATGLLHAFARTMGSDDLTGWVLLFLAILLVWTACGLLDIFLHQRRVQALLKTSRSPSRN